MSNLPFSNVAANESHPSWGELIKRKYQLYDRPDDIRSNFLRDYNRILHCTAYRRLKHKTQVFFATSNDHICTRIEHVNHVAAVSYTICKRLGLDTELSTAIATGHDLGHAPFGHYGELILKEIIKVAIGENFWHEKNSLHFIDNLETLTGPDGNDHNLNLTYAVRDGIISHCGEVEENAISPRDTYIPLEDISKPSEYQPYTWEGCVVKISDKISFLGRDIEDAIALNILIPKQVNGLIENLKDIIEEDLPIREINNTALMHGFIIDLCDNSNPCDGIRFSQKYLELINTVKKFNNDNIYQHPRLDPFKKYARLIIETLYKIIEENYDGLNTLCRLNSLRDVYPQTIKYFLDWLVKYSNIDMENRVNFHNDLVYNIELESNYKRAIIDYISGMTDSFAINSFQEIATL